MSTSPPETASFQPQSTDVSNSDTISLISSLLDAKLYKTFGDFKRSSDERDVETQRELRKKLKTDSKAASSLQFKGNSSLTASIWQSLICPREICWLFKNTCKRPSWSVLLTKVPAGWAAVEEYGSDELAENSEFENKLRVAERRALIKIKQKSSNLPCFKIFKYI